MTRGHAVLGASDPEMEMIEDILSTAGWTIHRAIDPETGAPVTAGRAYSGPAIDPPLPVLGPDDRRRLAIVECSPDLGAGPDSPLVSDRWDVVWIDHHREGDAGFGAPPDEYLEASSLGQILGARLRVAEDLVGIEPPLCGGPFLPAVYRQHWRGRWTVGGPGHVRWDGVILPVPVVLTMAADHCLPAAYAGMCPGVEPGDLLEYRIGILASRRPGGRSMASIDAVESDIEAALDAICFAPDVIMGGVRVSDLRGRHIPELPEAACRVGFAYLATVTGPDGRRKVVLGGCGEGTVPGPEPVRAFLAGEGPAAGLVGLYGDPSRGFAGGFEA